MQIRLSDAHYRHLRHWADRLGISLSEAARRCVADRLAIEGPSSNRNRLVAEALSVVGKYSDPAGPSRVAAEHDLYLS